jgi:hypothetical protein
MLSFSFSLWESSCGCASMERRERQRVAELREAGSGVPLLLLWLRERHSG